MSTYTSEPGTRLAGRYRLEDQVDAGGGWALWKAIDEILARPVSVLTFAENFPRVRDAVTAARAASRLTDSRLSQVFDVDDSGERAYIVMEWVAGDSLADMLSGGPIEPARAAALVAEAAQALSVAHAAGLAHLRLVPGSLHWTPGGGVKITGLGIDAALAGVGGVGGVGGLGADGDIAEDPALTDTQDLGRLLYAAVTGYWPGPELTSLPPAPMADGAPCTPRQVSAGVPAPIDTVTCQALFQRPGRDGSVVTTPLEFADALTRVAPPMPPAPPPYRRADETSRRSDTAQMAGYAGQRPPTRPEPAGRAYHGSHGSHGPPERPGGYRRDDRQPRGAAAKTMITVVVVLVLAAVAALGWSLSHSSGHTAAQAGRSQPPSPSTASSVVLKPVQANGFDPLSNDPGNENNGGAKYAIDSDPSTFWHTDFYLNNPVFGGLKKGTGLILDMGTQVRLSQLTVQFGSKCCANVHIEIGNNNTRSAATLGTFTTVASSSTASGTATFRVSSPVKGRYVLIWFTSLPPMAGSSSQYQAQIYDIVVRGSS
jgi:serine/threonine protein kinase